VAGALGLLLVAVATGRRPGAGPALLLPLAAACAGVAACDHRLSTQGRARQVRLQLELPTVAELVALAVAAGEGPAAAIGRVARLCPGDLGRELARTLADIRVGVPLTTALRTLADRHELMPLRRFVAGVVVAVERGTPLAEVLRAQAVDALVQWRRELVESAARREVAMLVPVVFLVLPVSVVFALFPGFYGLSLGVG
jgi:tight adherence protein C